MRTSAARRPAPRYDDFDRRIRPAVLSAIDELVQREGSSTDQASTTTPELAKIRVLEQLIMWSEHEITAASVRAVAAGASMTEIGEALGMSKQGAAAKLNFARTNLDLARASR